MDVRILETGKEHATTEIDHLGIGPHESSDLLVASDGRDGPLTHGDGVGPTPRGVHRVHGAVHEREIGRSRRVVVGQFGPPVARAGVSIPEPRLALRSSGEGDQIQEILTPEVHGAVGHHEHPVRCERLDELDVVTHKDHRPLPARERLRDGCA